MATDTRDRIVNATAALVQRHGFHGTSLSAILAESRAPSGSLYFHFPGGKEEIVLEATRAGATAFTELLERTLRESGDPVAGVKAYIQAVTRQLRASDYMCGCPVAPVILDAPSAASPLAELSRQTLTEMRRLYREALEAAGIEQCRAQTLATTITASLEGGLLIVRAERDTAALEHVAGELEALIRHAMAD